MGRDGCGKSRSNHDLRGRKRIESRFTLATSVSNGAALTARTSPHILPTPDLNPSDNRIGVHRRKSAFRGRCVYAVSHSLAECTDVRIRSCDTLRQPGRRRGQGIPHHGRRLKHAGIHLATQTTEKKRGQ